MPANSAAVGMPPGPPLPRWMQTLGFILAPVPFIDAARRRYGDVVTFRSLFDPGFVMVFDSLLVKDVLRGSPEQLRAGEANAPLGPVVGERSVLLLDGAEHMRQRKLLLPPFHGQRMRAYEEVMLTAADRAIDSWPVAAEFTLMGSMQSVALEVILRAVFGVGEGQREEDLKRRLREMIEPIANRLGVIMLVLSGGRRGSGAGERFAEQRRRVDEMLYAEIERRRAEPDLAEREDVLSMLVLARDEGGSPMTDYELRDELLTLLVAGHETTATGLAWAFELLIRNPGVLEKLRGELAAGDDAYLGAVVKETLRIRPVISGIGRVVRGEPFEVGEFRPERFLGDDAPDTYTWLPFGGGTRRCIGASFAELEMRTVIRRVLERTDLEPAGKPERAVRRGITFVPKRGVRVMQRGAARPPGA